MGSFKYNEEIELVDSGILIDKKILIIADLHIGYEVKLQKLGLQIPYYSEEKILNKLKLLLETYKPEMVIINGDLKHDFASFEGNVKRIIISVLDTISTFSKLKILIGNHDHSVLGLLKYKEFDIEEYYIYNSYFICHGDKFFHESVKDNIKTIIIGHQHPAIILKESGRKEKYKCFITGMNTLRKKEILVLPSFNDITIGTDLTTTNSNTPYLHNDDLDNFHIYSSGEEILDFQTLKLIKEINQK